MDPSNNKSTDVPVFAMPQQTPEDTERRQASVGRLSDLCVRAIAANVQCLPFLNKLPEEYAEQVLELLDTDMPLTLAVPLLPESVFWQRACKQRWQTMNYVGDYGGSWKRMFLEQHLQYFLECLDPDTYSETEMVATVRLCAPYVSRLRLRQFVHSKKLVPRRLGDRPQEGDPLCNDHINFTSILSELPKLEELDIVFGMSKLELERKPEYFMFSKQDCNNIGLGMAALQYIKKLRIHRSLLDNGHLASLVQHLLFIQSLECVDFSNCLISDNGGLILGQLLCKNNNLKKIVLINNKIGMDGAHFLAHALTVTQAKLELLNLRLNPIGDGGAAYLCSALVVTGKLTQLNVSGCGITEKGAKKISRMLLYSKGLKVLDLSNNWIGEKGAEAVLLSLGHNTSLAELDMRMTGLSSEHKLKLARHLKRNQHRNILK